MLSEPVQRESDMDKTAGTSSAKSGFNMRLGEGPDQYRGTATNPDLSLGITRPCQILGV